MGSMRACRVTSWGENDVMIHPIRLGTSLKELQDEYGKPLLLNGI